MATKYYTRYQGRDSRLLQSEIYSILDVSSKRESLSWCCVVAYAAYAGPALLIKVATPGDFSPNLVKSD